MSWAWGCAFAILAAQSNLRVAVLERDVFPRFKIGKSLLLENLPLFKRLGLLETLNSGQFQKKRGAVSTNDQNQLSMRFCFADAIDKNA